MEKKYYIAVEGSPTGPFTAEELLQQGLTAESRIFARGWTEMRSASDVPELVELLKKARKPSGDSEELLKCIGNLQSEIQQLRKEMESMREKKEVETPKRKTEAPKKKEKKPVDKQLSPKELYEMGIAAYNRKDYLEARHRFGKAAEKGHTRAQYYLGCLFRNGLGTIQDLSEALIWYRKAADHGDADAQNNLGFMYEEGLGLQQDYVEALKWYRFAADQGDAIAQFNLGRMYEEGSGVKQDNSEALKWYRKAAEQGDKDAKKAIKSIERGNKWRKFFGG